MKFLIYILFISCCNAFPAPIEKIPRTFPQSIIGNFKNWNPVTVAEYLIKFGYISKHRMEIMKLGGLIDASSFSDSIEEFQRMAGIKPTGKIDEKTVEMISLPRCGVEDTVGAFMMGSEGNIADSKFRSKDERRKAKRMKKNRKKNKGKPKSRTKRYNIEGGKWNKKIIKYHIFEYTEDMSRKKVNESITKALQLWEKHTTLKFMYTNRRNEADFKISFEKKDHGDNYPFDGRGGILAHAYFPSDGRTHFDDDEQFTYKENSGVNLFIVAAHEFGHSLGLAHSNVPNSLMAPFYQGYVRDFSLHPDDIAGIQELYGKGAPDPNEEKEMPSPTKPSNEVPPTRKPVHRDAMQICGKDISFDSMHYNYRSKALFALKGAYYWKITDKNGAAPGYPRKIHRYWRGLPSNLNASVYSKITRKTYFFKGNRVWIFLKNRSLEEGFPKKTSALGLPTNPQAAMQWGKDGFIYVFKNGYFYQFSEYQSYNQKSRLKGKKTSKFWNGIPNKIDAATQWKDGKPYFFKDNYYWRFSGMGRDPDKHYPKSFQKFWIGCENENNPYYRPTKNLRSRDSSRRPSRIRSKA